MVGHRREVSKNMTNGAAGLAAFDVVVFDYDGVCTPSAGEFIASEATPLPVLRPQLSSVVAELRERGSTIVLLSNEFNRQWISEIDDFPAFDHVLVGSDNRIFKSDRRAFQRVLHVTGCAAANCLVIDDDDTNVRVAQSIGCQTIHFDVDDAESSWTDVLAAAAASSRRMT